MSAQEAPDLKKLIPQDDDDALEATQRELPSDDEIVEQLQPMGRTEPKEWHFSYAGQDRTYVQKPLSYFGKLEFFQLVSTTIKLAMMGDDGISLNDILGGRAETITDVRDLKQDDFLNLDAFLNIAVTLGAYAPDFLKDCYAVWLAVPRDQRAWFREAISATEEDGGLTDEEGLEVIEIFVLQNGKAIRSFFEEQLRKMWDRAKSQLVAAGSSTPQQKLSRRTPQRTRSR